MHLWIVIGYFQLTMNFKFTFILTMSCPLSFLFAYWLISVGLCIISSLTDLQEWDGGHLATMIVIEQIVPFHESELIQVASFRCHIETEFAEVHGF